MAVPFIDIKRFEAGFLDKWQQKVTELSANASFIGGAEVHNLEQNLLKWTETQYAVTCANGTDALQLALRALGVGKDDIVLVPNSTFWATFEAVVNVNASPALVDVDMNDGGVDIEAFKEAVHTLKPKAAIIVHLYGWGSARIQELRAFCQEINLPLLEDGAQCFGTRINGESIYKDAYISTTSFYPAKVLGAAGDGGAVFTNDQALADQVRMYSNHGRSGHYAHAVVGWNSRLDSFQAAFLNLSLEHLEARIASRREAAQFYHTYLAQKGIQQIKAPEGYFENGYCNVCLIEKDTRLAIQQKFVEHKIGFGNIYPSAMSLQPCAAEFSKGTFGKDASIRLGEQVLNLPLFPYMRDEELQEVCQVLESVI